MSKKQKRIYNQASLFGPLYAYLVVLSPNDAIKASVAQIKKELNDIEDITERNLHSIAHITLVDKLTDDVNFSETIAAFVQDKKPFDISINGWNYFDHGHSVTIYLTIENPKPIVELMTAVKSPSKSPHISLVKKVPHATLHKLKPYLDWMDFKAQWRCSEVIVLKKLMSEKHLGFKDSITVPLKTI